MNECVVAVFIETWCIVNNNDETVTVFTRICDRQNDTQAQVHKATCRQKVTAPKHT